MKQTYKQDKGTAGLTILLSIVIMLFIIGLIVMIFTLMGAGLQDATYTDTIATATNETASANLTGFTLSGTSARTPSNFVVTALWNRTANVKIGNGNATISAVGVVTNGTTTQWNNVSISYTYHYEADNTATNVMNDTTQGISGVTSYFDIFIVISAMIVLILLMVLIISAIKGSGLIGGGMTSGANQVGTA